MNDIRIIQILGSFFILLFFVLLFILVNRIADLEDKVFKLESRL